MKLLPIIILLLCQSVIAQVPYNHRLENGQIQAIGHLVVELDSSYLGIGRGIDTIDFRRGIYATKFDKETGEVLNTDKVTYPNSILEFNQLNRSIIVDNKHYFIFKKNDTIYLSTYSELENKISIEKKIYSLDTTNNLFIFDFLYKSGTYYILAEHSTNEKNVVLLKYTVDSDSIEEIFIYDVDGAMNAVKFLFLDNGNMLLSYTIYKNGAVLYLREIDNEGNTIWKYNNEIEREGAVRAFLKIDENFYFLGGGKGRETSDPDGEQIPYSFKFDYNQKKVVKKFDFSIQDSEWNKWNGLVEEIVPSHDGESYICVAELVKIRTDPDTLQGFGMIAKIDKDLNLLWKKKYSFLDFFHTQHRIVDIIATSDGNYLCYGTSVKGSVLPGEIPFLSWAFKIDEDGKIVGDTTTATVDWIDIDVTDKIEIFPNPASDYIYINQNDIEDVSYKVYGLRGRFIEEFTLSDKNQSVVKSVQNWNKGYNIIRLVKDGKYIGTMKVLKI